MHFVAGLILVIIGLVCLIFPGQLARIIRRMLVMMFGEDAAEMYSRPRADPWVVAFVGLVSLALGTVSFVRAFA